MRLSDRKNAFQINLDININVFKPICLTHTHTQTANRILKKKPST